LSDRDGSLLHIAGWTADASGQPHPVRWTLDFSTNPATQTLVELTNEVGQALQIHNNGSIVGWFRVGFTTPRAFLWKPGGSGANPPTPQFTDLGTLANGNVSVATGVAADGTVVGHCYNWQGQMRAFVCPPGARP
jgi:probable HAF family extracellular repeat protein